MPVYCLYSDPIASRAYFLWSLYLNAQIQVYLGYDCGFTLETSYTVVLSGLNDSSESHTSDCLPKLTILRPSIENFRLPFYKNMTQQLCTILI